MNLRGIAKKQTIAITISAANGKFSGGFLFKDPPELAVVSHTSLKMAGIQFDYAFS
jgi:hypothetical protein